MSTTIDYFRHYTARIHQRYAVTVSDEMLADPTYFDEAGLPTVHFDEWVCSQDDAKDEEDEPLGDWDLETEAVAR